MSDEFLYGAGAYLMQYSYSFVLYYLKNQKEKFSEIESFEEAERVLEKVHLALISLTKDTDLKYSFETVLDTFKVIGNSFLTDEYFANYIFESGLLKEMGISSIEFDSVKTYIDNIVKTGKIENVEKFINTIQKQIPDYASFPLLFINPNISKEEKEKAIKLTYKQKDFPKYKENFRNNLKDLNDLDAFIQATIINNNRVREKEDNIIKLLKDIFIPGDYYYQRKNEIIHSKEFFESYKQYFTNKTFMHRLYTEAVGSKSNKCYERKEQYENFCYLIYSSIETNDLIDLVAKIPELKVLGKYFPEKFKIAFAEQNDDVIERLLGVFATWSQDDFLYLNRKFNDSDGINFYTIMSKYINSKNLENYFNNIRLISYDKEKNSGRIPLIVLNSWSKSENIILLDICRVILGVKGAVEKFSLFDNDDNIYFGIKYDKIIPLQSRPWNYASSNDLDSIFTCVEAFYKQITLIIKDVEDQDILNAVYNKYVKIFENSENTNSLLSNIMDMMSDDRTKKVSNYNTSTPVFNKFEALIKYTQTIADYVYSKLDNLEENKHQFNNNISEIESTLNLLASF